MNKPHSFSRIVVAAIFLLSATIAYAGRPEDPKHQSRTAVTTTLDVYRPMLINNVFNYYGNNGDGSYNIRSTNNEGFEFPKGEGHTTIFEDGIVWGVKQRDTIKVGGSVYRHGLQAGPIAISGTPTALPVAGDESSTAHRVYRVRRDIRPIPGVTDPGDARAAGERAILESQEAALINRYESVTPSQLLQQYWDDWNGWPALLGAPYTDVDHNGAYDPAIDIPGPPGADQALWYVANDMNRLRTQNLSGSDPIGLEMQRSVWGYRRGGALNDALFMSSRVINKSGVTLDSVFIVQFSDPDVGDGGDDLVGCDTSAALGYAYNGTANDGSYGTTPPAVGFVLLQGPAVAGAPSDTALWGFSRHPSYRNLPLSAFVFFSSGFAGYADPMQGGNGYLEWWQIMQGRSTRSGPFIDPTTGDTSRFVFNGDPVTGTGWIDGKDLVPNDRRLCMVTGPFTMAPGDTQEIAFACYAARGADRLASVAALKREAELINETYTTLSSGLQLPILSHSLTRNGDHPVLSFHADARGSLVAGIQIQLKTYDGAVVKTVDLADDGNHQDGAAGDSVYGGSPQIAPLAQGIFADAVMTYRNGRVVTWTHIVDNIATADLTVGPYEVVSDNLNNDGIPNPGENVRYGFALRNASSVDLSHLVISASPEEGVTRLAAATLRGNTTQSWAYDPNDPATYLAFLVVPWSTDQTISIALTIADNSENIWRDTLVFPVRPLKSTAYVTPVQHVAGKATGGFEVVIVDSSKVKNHLYVIRGAQAPGLSSGYSVKDSTAGVILLENHPLPDGMGHTSPVIDGFKVRIGTIDSMPGMRSWEIPSGTRRFSYVGGFAGLGLEGFSATVDPGIYDRTVGTIGMAGHLAYGGIGTTLDVSAYHDVLLKLAVVTSVELWDPKATPSDTNFSRAYRYLRKADTVAASASFAPWIVNAAAGYPFQGYDYSVPFSAWDMQTDPPQRLAVGLMENNVAGGLVDGRYWPGITTVDNSVAREIAFIFKAPYTETADALLATNMLNNGSTPLMWVMTCSRRAEVPWVASDQFKINAAHMPTAADMWTFNPLIVASLQDTSEPTSFALLQNYPNPFNPATHVRFTIGAAAKTTLTVYDLLGRKVVVLVDDMRMPGTYEVSFDARGLASGVYFYRLLAGSFVQTRKLMLLH